METIHSAGAPAAIGPYAQAVACGGFVFCSGQIALDPATGAMTGATAADQARRVLRNLSAVLEAAGSGLDRVVKTTIYMVDLAEFGAVNDVYAGAFGDHRPARATVAVAGLPRGALVEIEAIAQGGP